ncbi:hypothetical protein CIL05_18605 [Virgibacillus profundi]|uniref:DUF4064 domain-containing protein n=1 Tax=Virgibacillus profundi TaxID=2024555 RepID=A0A2A2I9R5_9BACI|nr:DUF4064 domain-containing protein [Virgibacillus profundi]PAV28118.1 hypothetical protein CIL05_18605 [Virgibacillus profundi]PXY52423.1 DUF4064 domain-containing protein [Virgibacillus profundi]
MKRTGEVILGIVGAIVFTFLAFIGVAMIWLHNNEGLVQDILNEGTTEEFPEIAMMDLNEFVNYMGEFGWQIAIASVIAIVLGIVAMVLLRGNKKPKAAGIIFIVAIVVVAFTNIGLAVMGGIFYLIAAILCFARKQPTVSDEV